MCFGASAPTPPPPPPPIAPPPQLPDGAVQGAGAAASQRARALAGPLATIVNAGGAAGLTTPPATTGSKRQTGQ